MKVVFPVLLGEVSLAQLTSSSSSSGSREVGSYDCGDKRKEEDCCGTKAEVSSEQVYVHVYNMMHVVRSDLQHT